MAERRHRGGLLVRRAGDQWRLLTAILAVMVVGAALAGTCALLVGAGRWQALEAAAERQGADPAGGALVTVTAGVAELSSTAVPRSGDLVAAVGPAMDQALAPFHATTSTWVASPRLRLPGEPLRHSYLLDADTAAQHATLVDGRWPEGSAAGEPLEVAVPRVVAAPLGLAPGDRLSLTGTEGPDVDAVMARVVVVGLVDLEPSETWRRDPLEGAGTDTGGRVPVLGPLLTAPGALLSADAPAARVAVEADVDLTGDPAGLDALAGRVGGLRSAVQDSLAAAQVDVDHVTLRSGLPAFAADARTQLQLTSGIVLAVVVLVLVLSSAALVLVVRATSTARATQTLLVVERGGSRWRLLGWAAAENLVLGVVAGALAVPLAVLGYRALTAVGPPAEAWRTTVPVAEPGADRWLVGAVVVAVLVQVVVSVAVGVRGAAPRAGRFTHGGLARSGADLMLAVLAVLGYLQLRAHRPTAGAVDPVLVLAPALVVAGAAVLALRVLPLLVRLSERVARRSAGLVVPLAGWHVARGRATTGMLLAVLATASSTLAVSAQATWDLAQHQQADASVGADVSVRADGSAGQGAAVRAAADALGPGAVVTPVTDRMVGLGSRPGGAALVALDTRLAGDVLRAPVPGGWVAATRGLAPEVAADSLEVGSAPFEVVVDASLSGAESPGLSVTPTLVLQDDLGRLTTTELSRVEVDQGARRLRVPAAGTPDLPDGTWRVLAVRLAVSAPSSEPTAPSVDLAVDVQVVGATAAPDGWTATGDGQMVLGTPSLDLVGDRLTAEADVSLLGLSYAGATVLLTAFPAPEELPVAVSRGLADELGLAAGDVVDLAIGTVTVPATVAGVLPYVPARPREAAVLADSDALVRALLLADELDLPTDAWWVSSDRPTQLAEQVGGRAAVELGDRLAAGPLRAAAGGALAVLAAAAVLLAVAGAFARERAAAPERGLEVARLRGIGATRRAVLATSLLRHGLVTVAAVALGALVGGLLAATLAPALVVSGDGGALVPAPVGVWPWLAEAAVLAVLLLGSVLAGVPVARQVVARSTATVLRTGEQA